MRAIPLIVTFAAIGTLGACATQPPPDERAVAEGQAKFQEVTAGKVAGAPMSCLPTTTRTRNLIVIDDSTVAYEDSSRRVYVNHLRGACTNLHPGFNSLVVRSSGSGTCSGDIADVADPRTGITYGSCALGEFVPYTRP